MTLLRHFGPRARAVGLAVLAGLALGACAPVTAPRTRPLPSASADVAEGRRLAELHCAGCHAIGAAGESRHPVAPPFRELSRNYPVNQLEEAFAEGILVGHRDMPEFRFEPDQIDDLVGYLQSIQVRQGG